MSKGYVLTNEGDSLVGYISKRKTGDEDNLLFTKNKTDKVTYNIKNCKGFGFFKPAAKYERYEVKMDMSYFDQYFYLINADSIQTNILFLKNIYQGLHMSLYFYRDKNSKEHYFVKYKDSLEELVQKFRKPTLAEALIPGKSPNYIVVYIFRDQLLKYFDWQKNSKMKIDVEFAEYTYPRLLKIIKAIDKLNSDG
jgi:hypothetical protein